MSVPGNIIYFVGYDYLRNAIKDWTVYKQKDYAPLIAGGAARGIFHSIFYHFLPYPEIWLLTPRHNFL
jgi:hypothetical protein